MVGPTRVSPKKSARMGALARENSSESTTPWMRVRPLPPYSSGQVAQIHPPSKSFSVQAALNALRSSAVISKPSSNHPSGRFSSSQERISVRKSSASGGYVRSIPSSWPTPGGRANGVRSSEPVESLDTLGLRWDT